MMNLVLIGLVVVLGCKYVKANKRYVELLKTHKEVTNKYGEALKKNIQVQQQLLNAMSENRKLKRENNTITDKYIDAVTLLDEHSVIFRNLQEDNMCLAKAQKAFDDVSDMLILDKEVNRKAVRALLEGTLVYDGISQNYYDNEAGEITISMFDDYENEQGKFMYDYLNDKYGISLDGSDIRTSIIFTVLHEVGHCVDYSNKEVSGEIDEYRELNWTQKLALEGMEDEIESWRAYREIPTEAFADKFAVEFMIKHFPELV